MQLRVLTYNIHKGFCFYSRQYVLHELRHAIRIVDADLVFLQEVSGIHPPKVNQETEIESQFEFLADEIWSHVAYGKNAVYTSGHHGNAILSKYPIVGFENLDISNNRLERRGLLHAKIQYGDKESQHFHAVNLHLDLFEGGRRQQVSRLVNHVREKISQDHPLIVAGDFNDWTVRLSEPLAQNLSLREAGLECLGRHALTFPSWWPLLALDRVYTRGFNVRSHTVLHGRPWGQMSDHAAVMVELTLTTSVNLNS